MSCELRPDEGPRILDRSKTSWSKELRHLVPGRLEVGKGHSSAIEGAMFDINTENSS